MGSLEKRIWIHTLCIVGMGLMALYSASFQNIRVTQEVFYDQMVCGLLGLGFMYYLKRIDYRKFYDAAYIFYIFNILLLIFVLGMGRYALGARRWIEIGAISFQPSELAKLSLIFALGRYFSNRRPTLSFNFLSKAQLLFRDLIFPLLFTAASMILVFKQPDLGSSLVLFGIFLVMLFASGLEYRYLMGFAGACLAFLPWGWHLLKDYQKDRLLVFLNPNIDPLGAGYTIIQSKIAIGSGQWLGKGWLAGTQNQLNFLPERHTDFIFSVIGEEWGFLGALILIYCYFVLIDCGFKIIEQTKDKFGIFVAVGIIGNLSLQVIINAAMVMGLCPVVGITLPLVSWGRSSLLVSMIMIGFLLNLNRKRMMT